MQAVLQQFGQRHIEPTGRKIPLDDTLIGIDDPRHGNADADQMRRMDIVDQLFDAGDDLLDRMVNRLVSQGTKVLTQRLGLHVGEHHQGRFGGQFDAYGAACPGNEPQQYARAARPRVDCAYLFGLLIALLMNQQVRGISIFRTIWYLPSVLSSVAVAVLWLWILNPRYGLLNRGLALIGIDGPAWLVIPTLTKPAVIIRLDWK